MAKKIQKARSRRPVAGGLAALLVLAVIFASCGSSSKNSGNASANAAGSNGGKPALSNPFPVPAAQLSGTPKVGGTLTIGMTGGGPSDSLNPNVNITTIDPVRAAALYDTLAVYNGQQQIVMQLATSITPNNTANTSWTIKLRPNVKFSDGTDLTAADVLYTWKTIVANQFPGAPALAEIDLKATHMVNPLTIDVICTRPVSILPELMTNDTLYIVKNGFTNYAHGADGTGPFTFVSWTPGQQSVFVRNPNYWGHKAYASKLVMDDLASDTAMNNALVSGQINAALFMAPTAVQLINSNSANLYLTGMTGQTAPNFYLRTDIPPFNNPAILQAMKLSINRRLCVQSALGGLGSVANDLYGYSYPSYAYQIPQTPYDPQKAKQILAQAGIHNLTVTLTAGNAVAGMLACSEVFQQSAAAAGITIKIHQIPDSEVFDESTVYLKVPFGMSGWEGNSFEAQALQTLVTGAAFNETHFSGPDQQQFMTYWHNALAATDPTVRQQDFNNAQALVHEKSGAIVWGFALILNGFSKQVHGTDVLNEPSRGYRTFGLNYIWLS
jgi:peptide/nickel transport system substrate-binding protein